MIWAIRAQTLVGLSSSPPSCIPGARLGKFRFLLPHALNISSAHSFSSAGFSTYSSRRLKLQLHFGFASHRVEFSPGFAPDASFNLSKFPSFGSILIAFFDAISVEEMASIRRTLSPYGERSYQNGSNNPFSIQSSSQKLLSNTRTTLSPLHRFLSGVFLQKHNYKKSNHFSLRKWLYRCVLFFLLGFILGMAPFNSDFNELKQQGLSNSDFSFEMKPQVVNAEKNEGDIGVVDIRKENHMVLDAVELGVVERSGQDVTDRTLGYFVPQKQLIVVTPTYNRALQAYFLNRLGQVLRLVRQPVLWIVVEMNAASMETADILRNMGIMYRHLVCTKNSTDMKDRGVHQRNTALEHIERHRLDGIVYFADDDNIYSLDLFESIREISRFGVWPVGMLAQSKNKAILEGPVCNGSQVIGWHTNEKSKRLRRFHVDMSGFAFNSTILWDPKRRQRATSDPIRQLDTVKEGFQETTFIEQIVEDESHMEGIPPGCYLIMNWHLHLEARELIYPKGWMLQKNLDVVLPSKE